MNILVTIKEKKKKQSSLYSTIQHISKTDIVMSCEKKNDK